MNIKNILISVITPDEKLKEVQQQFMNIITKDETKYKYVSDFTKEEFTILSFSGDFPYDDFAVAINNKNEIYIIYSYDGGYGFPRVRISELFNYFGGDEK